MFAPSLRLWLKAVKVTAVRLVLTELRGDLPPQRRELVDTIQPWAFILYQAYHFAVIKAIPGIVVFDLALLSSGGDLILKLSVGKERMTIRIASHAFSAGFAYTGNYKRF